MRAVVLDMYGVIVKQTGDDFVPYVQQTFPHLKPEDVYEHWFKADAGELTSLEVWHKLGFKGDLEKIEKEYFDTISISGDLKIKKPDKRIFHHTINNLGCKLEDCIYVDDREGNLNAASELGMSAIMFNSRNSEYSGNVVNGFKELDRMIKLGV